MVEKIIVLPPYDQ
jgi:hypothetical protein